MSGAQSPAHDGGTTPIKIISGSPTNAPRTEERKTEPISPMKEKVAIPERAIASDDFAGLETAATKNTILRPDSSSQKSKGFFACLSCCGTKSQAQLASRRNNGPLQPAKPIRNKKDNPAPS